MNQVWFFFKVFELVIGSICMYYHIRGALYSEEPLPHNLMFCGTFIAYMLINMTGILRIFVKTRTLMLREFFITSSGSVLHYICGCVIMYYAEIDFHLTFMGDKQELEHFFFAICKKQSIASIVNGTMYLIHALLVLEIITKAPHTAELTGAESLEGAVSMTYTGYEYRDYMAKTSAEVYFLSQPVDQFLRNHSKWFRELAEYQDAEPKALEAAHSHHSQNRSMTNLHSSRSDRSIGDEFEMETFEEDSYIVEIDSEESVELFSSSVRLQIDIESSSDDERPPKKSSNPPEHQ
ncbi:uncharacterized protein LOC115626568 [Scaptodrosophila lebanonensis]|uniref:Uncharacterized protein LOC115626568 n=1 Tax=Drosophila lebanonensis TaxID=7225 RepID=A0A6J2TSA6_DROLE|nr:uncharacterized protein LOC115626568 [Scaptodrosophila lebanonensis]